MQATLVAVAAIALAACVPTIPDTAQAAPAVAPVARFVQVDVLDRDSGEHLPVYWHNGQRWVAGTPGHRYGIAVQNRSAGRVLAVISVDSVNAVSGETAGWSQNGYVLAPWQSYDIIGWRKSTAAVADFLFTSVQDSYAARTGRGADAGVIGVAVFPEARPIPAEPPVSILNRMESLSSADASARAAPAPASPAEGATAKAQSETSLSSIARQRLGTGHGQSESSPVSMIDFERARDRPDEIITIRYDRYERLVAMGVIASVRPLPPAPDAFPASANAGFVPDPQRRD